MGQARTPTPTTRSGVKLNNHETAVPLYWVVYLKLHPKSVFYSFSLDLESVFIFLPESLLGSTTQGDLAI